MRPQARVDFKLADLNAEAIELAEKIQANFEEALA
jgi:hypothetical protein